MKHPSKHRGKRLGGSRRSHALARILPAPLLALGGSGGGLLLALSFVMVVVSSVNPGGVAALRLAAADMLAPALGALSMPVQKAALMARDVSGLAGIQAENVRLSEENTRLREWYQTALMLEAENKSLRELLNVKIEPQNRYVTARVISDSASPFAKSMLVAAGTKDGVRKGQAVVSGEGLVGRIIEAGEGVSRILLITDINSRVPVFVEDTRRHAIFAGDNAGQGRLMHIPPDGELRAGARIITSGQGGIFPMGMPVGVIAKDDQGNISVTPFTDFSQLVYVRIVERPEDPNLRSGSGFFGSPAPEKFE